MAKIDASTQDEGMSEKDEKVLKAFHDALNQGLERFFKSHPLITMQQVRGIQELLIDLAGTIAAVTAKSNPGCEPYDANEVYGFYMEGINREGQMKANLKWGG